MDILRIVREASPEEWVYNDFTTYVFTHHEHTSSKKIRFVNINPVDLVKSLKEENGKDI